MSPQKNYESELRWQCRRGMLELDILLSDFIEQGYANLNDEEKESFERLLEYPDQTLIDLLLGHMRSSERSIHHIVSLVNPKLIKNP